MKKKGVILTLFAAVIAGGLTSWGVTSAVVPNHGTMQLSSGNEKSSDFHFVGTSSQAQNILPDFTAAAERGVKSVVNIDVVKKMRVNGGYSGGGGGGFFEYFFGNPSPNQQPQYRDQRGGGSGVIISEDGYIVSNNHVVTGADQIKVTTSDGERYTAKLIGADPNTDIALLKIEATGLPVLPFGNSDDLRLGEWVLAVGNPYGLTSTVTQGIISAKGRSIGAIQSNMGIESFIQTDAAVNHGNSGGALITLDGTLVGINTLIQSPTGAYAGYSFAVPSSIVRKVASDLREFGVVQRAMLGILMREITAEWIEEHGDETGIKTRGGVYIGEVAENGAAAAAGIKAGDVLIAIDGVPVNRSSEVQEAIIKYRPNDKVKVSVKRDGAVKQFEVTLRNKSGNTDIVSKNISDIATQLGAKFTEISDKLKKELKISTGVQVVAIEQSGLLARSKVKPGYIITAINDIPMTSIAVLNSTNIEQIYTIEGIYPDGKLAAYSVIVR